MYRKTLSGCILGFTLGSFALALGAHGQDTSKSAAHPDAPKHSRKQNQHPSRNTQKTHSASDGTINPYTAKPVQEYHATEIQSYQASPAQTANAAHSLSSSAGATLHGASGMDVLLHTFGLAIPGVAYTVDNYATETRTVVTSSGTVTKSAVRVNPNHTYDWNSAWDNRLIHGRWVESKDGVLLLNGQEHKNWLLRSMEKPSGKATVSLWDQNSTWYNGTPLN